MSIRWPYLVAMLVAMGSLLACIVYWRALADSHESVTQEFETRIEQRARQLADAITQQMDTLIRGFDLAARQLRDDYIRNPTDFDHSVRIILGAYPVAAFRYVSIIGADGILKYASIRTDERLDFSESDYFRFHASSDKDQLFISKPEHDRIGDGWMIILSRPIRKDGRFLGIIMLSMQPSYLARNLAELNTDTGDIVALLNPDGSFLARNSSLSEVLGTVAPVTSPFINAAPGDKGTFRGPAAVSGEQRLFAWRRSSHWPLFVITGFNEQHGIDMLAGSQHEEIQRGIAGILLVMAFSLSIAFLLIHVERQKLGLEVKVAERTADLSSANAALFKEKEQQRALIGKLEQAQTQLLQSEKMAAIGQLAAGVAHEINNPIGFVNSNLGTLSTYIDSLLKVMAAYETEEQALPDERRKALETLRNGEDLAYLLEDIGKLIHESKDGLQRVKRIVTDLKNFSHVDESEWHIADLERGIESTLNVVWNELKYKAEIVKKYGHPPAIECIPSQLNQVFMNLLINAAQAIESHGTITIRTGTENDKVWVEIEDTGKGIAPENLNRIFEPFFTTKAVGEGTGLGLSLSYGIIDKHKGTIAASSELGKGTKFRVTLPQTDKA